jgi:hypothetical protein
VPVSKKPRKPRKLPAGRKDTISKLFDGDAPITGDERVGVLTSVHAAASALSRGDGDKGEWDRLVYAMNIAVILCETAGNKEVGLQPVYDAMNALIAMRERHQETGRLVFGVNELPALNAGIEVWEALVDTVSRRQYVRASEEVLTRLSHGRSIKVQAGGKTARFALPMAA